VAGIAERAGLDFVVDHADQALGLGDVLRGGLARERFPAQLALVAEIHAHGFAAHLDSICHLRPHAKENGASVGAP